jgi:LPXTG-motif cell wall-anchored protein
MKHAGLFLLMLGAAGFAVAGTPAPEINGTSAAAAIALVSGGLLVIRGRRKK